MQPQSEIRFLNDTPSIRVLRLLVSFKHTIQLSLHLSTLNLSHLFHLSVKVKVKFNLEQATKAQRDSRSIALLFL